jgi:hypothetical protein
MELLFPQGQDTGKQINLRMERSIISYLVGWLCHFAARDKYFLKPLWLVDEIIRTQGGIENDRQFQKRNCARP